MALIRHVNLRADAELGIWKLVEDEHWFFTRLDLLEEEKELLERLHVKQRKQWLASRWLLHEMSGREVRGKVLKDAFGKPYLEDSKWTISLSHSSAMAAVIAAAKPCGIDIQRIVPKVLKLAPKFMSADEIKSLNNAQDIEKIHVYWGAKESLYKLYSQGKIDFKKNLIIRPFEYGEKGRASGLIKMDSTTIECNIRYEKIDNYMLVWAINAPAYTDRYIGDSGL